MPATDAACGVQQRVSPAAGRNAAEDVLSDLLSRCARKDYPAWDEFVRRFKNDVYTLAFRFLGDRQDAEDVAIEAFLRLWHAPWWSAKPRIIKAWLAKVTQNLCADLLRDSARQREKRFCEVTPQEIRRYGPVLPMDMVHIALSRLSLDQRRSVILCMIHGLSSDDAALVMGRSAGTIRRWLSEARVLLRRDLGEASDSRGEAQ